MSGIDPLFPMAGAVAMAMLFGAAALHKLTGAARFGAVVGDYRLLPAPLVPLAALGIPLVEMAVALAALRVLLAGGTRLLASAAAMLLLYGGAMAANLLRGRRHIDCGCTAFGAPETTIGWPLVARNAGIAAVVLLLAAAPVAARALGAADVIALIGVALVLPALYVAFGEWRALRPGRITA